MPAAKSRRSTPNRGACRHTRSRRASGRASARWFQCRPCAPTRPAPCFLIPRPPHRWRRACGHAPARRKPVHEKRPAVRESAGRMHSVRSLTLFQVQFGSYHSRRKRPLYSAHAPYSAPRYRRRRQHAAIRPPQQIAGKTRHACAHRSRQATRGPVTRAPASAGTRREAVRGDPPGATHQRARRPAPPDPVRRQADAHCSARPRRNPPAARCVGPRLARRSPPAASPRGFARPAAARRRRPDRTAGDLPGAQRAAVSRHDPGRAQRSAPERGPAIRQRAATQTLPRPLSGAQESESGTMNDIASKVLDSIEIETGPSPRYAVIWLHGLGADGNDFAPIVPELGLGELGPIRFVFPHAPMQPVTINNGMVMRAWYDIIMTDLVRREDEKGLRESQLAVEALIARENARGIATERIVLAGFSQGCAMALQTGLRHPARLAGIIGL